MPPAAVSFARAIAIALVCTVAWIAFAVPPGATDEAPLGPAATASDAGRLAASAGGDAEARGDAATFMTCHLSCVCFFTCHTGYPYAPSLVSPANGAVVASTPTLTATYSHSMGTRGDLHFEVCSDSTCGAVLQTGTALRINSGSNGSFTPTTLADGTYYWRARGFDGSLYGSYSAIWSFQVGASSTPPSNTALPAISGTTTELQTLSASTGTWSGTTPMTYAYQWRSCDSAGTACADIVGATSSTYVLDRSDVGLTVRVVVTASNSAGSASATSDATAIVAASSSTYVDSPGSATSTTNGSTITVTTGVKASAHRLLVAVIVNNSDAAVTSVTDSKGGVWTQARSVANGTALATHVWATYTTRALPTGSSVDVTWSGSSSRRSVVIYQFTGATKDVNTTGSGTGSSVTPSASATTTTPRTLMVGAHGFGGPSTETWSTAAPFSFLSVVGTSGGGSHVATASTTHSVATTGAWTTSGTLGSSRTWASALVAFGAVDSATVPPVNTVLPTITGTAATGSTLTASTGTWQNSPTAYAYQWERCDSAGANCVAISGATSSSYVPQAADVGATLRVVVTASNAGGATSAISAQTAVVAEAPTNTGLPVVSGTTTEGSTLGTTDGTWSGSPTSYTYQWRRCDSTGAACADITGATSATYVLVAADIGSTIRSVVTATNAVGSASATSAATAVVSGVPPTNSLLPTTGAAPREGTTSTATAGSWTGTAPITFTWQWQLCDAGGLACTNIAGATTDTYVPTTSDVGGTLRVVVTGTNSCSVGCGSASATSAASAVIAPASGDYAGSPAQGATKTTGTTLVLTTTTEISADHLLVLVASSNTGGTLASVVDSQGNDWFADASQANGTSVTGNVWSSYVVRPMVAGSTITITWSASSSVRVASLHEFTGTRGRLPDGTGSALGSSTAPSSSLTAANAVDVLFGAQSTNGPNTDSHAPTAPMVASTTTGTSGGGANVTAFAQHHRTSAAGTHTAAGTLGTSRAWASIVTAYQAGDGVTQPPQSTGAPVVTGTTVEGSTLTTSTGTWTNAPSSYLYQWHRCDLTGSNCVAISGASSASYVLVAADVGSTLRAVVIAVNAGGSRSATSAATAEIDPAPTLTMSLAGYGSDGSGPFSSPAATPLGATLPGDDRRAELRVTVATGNATGYALSLRDPDGNGAVHVVATPTTNVPWTASGSIAAPAAWGGSGLGVSLYGSAGAPDRWCSGGQANCTSGSDIDLLWAPVTGTDQVVGGSSVAVAGGQETRMPIRAVMPATQAAGTYEGTVAVSAVANP